MNLTSDSEQYTYVLLCMHIDSYFHTMLNLRYKRYNLKMSLKELIA